MNMRNGLKASFVFMILTAVVLVTAASAYMNEPEGFRGLQWGSPVGELPYKEFYKTGNSAGEIDYYKRTDERLYIGGAQLTSLLYGFWSGKFASVLIRTNGLENWVALKDAVFGQWGKTWQPDKTRQYFVWTGDKTDIVLEYREHTQVGTLYLTSVELNRDRAVSLKKTRKPTSDF